LAVYTCCTGNQNCTASAGTVTDDESSSGFPTATKNGRTTVPIEPKTMATQTTVATAAGNTNNSGKCRHPHMKIEIMRSATKSAHSNAYCNILQCCKRCINVFFRPELVVEDHLHFPVCADDICLTAFQQTKEILRNAQ